MILKKITIEKIHGFYNYEVTFHNNRLIIVGENGTGKSTFVSILFYLLTLQWRALTQYEFTDMEISIDDETFSFNHAAIVEHVRGANRHRFPEEIAQEIESFVHQAGLDYHGAQSNLTLLYQEYMRSSRHRMPFEIFQQHIASRLQSVETSFGKFEQFANAHLPFTIVYLPTYRRIEKEIKNIFPHIEDQIRQRLERRHIKLHTGPKRHLELIEFGMEDVSRLIQNSMHSLNNYFRSSLESLTGNYLREILRASYDSAITLPFKKNDLGQIDIIFSRIDEKILDQHDKITLKNRIIDILNKDAISESDKIIIKFIQSLSVVHQEQLQKEEKVRTFVDICNKYLVEKKLIFNANNFDIRVLESKSNANISLESLSSGEKQIISIFAHLYLSEDLSYFLIIDEPELSLSVPWQKNFLLDISLSNQCTGFVAVTHSPFIYDNDLVGYAHAINEFRRL